MGNKVRGENMTTDHGPFFYTKEQAMVYTGLWIERRAREIGMIVRVTPSRDRDELLRQIDAPGDLLEELVNRRPEIASDLPSTRDEGKAHSRLFHFKATAADGPERSRFSSLERTHLLMALLTSDFSISLDDLDDEVRAPMEADEP